MGLFDVGGGLDGGKGREGVVNKGTLGSHNSSTPRRFLRKAGKRIAESRCAARRKSVKV